MKERVAIYPGTFDPITLGHLDVIRSSSALFDQIIIGLLTNSLKKPRFTEEERKEMTEEAVADIGLGNVRVKTFKGLTVELARQEKALAIIRGLRLATEYEQELGLIFNNQILEPSIIPVLIPPRQEHIHISSTVVRELMSFGHSDLSEYVPLAVLEYLGLADEKYKARLLEACHRLVGNSAGTLLCKELVKRYQKPSRFYHTLRHINDCLDELDKAKSLLGFPLDYPNEVEMALLFHDAEDDEEKSAELAKKMLQTLGLPDEFIERVAKIIFATKHDIPPEDFDAQIAVDIDLASLGCTEKIFDKNAARIREEYKHVPEEIFRKERARILGLFLKRPNVYLTRFFRDRYEAQARQNLTRAIKQLSE